MSKAIDEAAETAATQELMDGTDGEAMHVESAPSAAAAAPEAHSRRAVPRKANAASRRAAASGAMAVSADDAADAASSHSHSRKRRLSLENDGAAAVAVGVHSAKAHAAASMIQAAHRARIARKQSSLWNAWNELDWKEEAALMNSHAAYESLKKAVQDRRKADDETEKKAAKGAAVAKGKKAISADQQREIELGVYRPDTDPLTLVWVYTMMDCFKNSQQLPASTVFRLIREVTPLLRALPNIVHVSVTARVTVVGDLHGQLDDLLAIFKLQGSPSPRNKFVFNGE
jgi:hypothetical protein